MKNVIVVSMAAIVGVGCGGKKDENKANTEAAKPADPNQPAAKPDEATPAEAKPAEAKPKEPVAEDFSKGYCRVTGSGAVTFDQKTPHTGGSMLNVLQWHTEEMRTKLGMGAEGIILNCLGKDIRLNILSGKNAFPTKPATYTFGKGGNIRIMGIITHPDEPKGLSVMQSNGSLEITAFDDKHIAGKGEVTVSTLPNKGDVKLGIEFDMQCHGLSGCP